MEITRTKLSAGDLRREAARAKDVGSATDARTGARAQQADPEGCGRELWDGPADPARLGPSLQCGRAGRSRRPPLSGRAPLLDTEQMGELAVIALRAADGRAMPRLLRGEIDRLKRRLTLTRRLIRGFGAERSATLATAPSDDAARMSQCYRVRGVGDSCAAVLTREVFYRHFDNRRQLASYVVIVPTLHQSGAMERNCGIGRAGNARARAALIQVAWP